MVVVWKEVEKRNWIEKMLYTVDHRFVPQQSSFYVAIYISMKFK